MDLEGSWQKGSAAVLALHEGLLIEIVKCLLVVLVHGGLEVLPLQLPVDHLVEVHRLRRRRPSLLLRQLELLVVPFLFALGNVNVNAGSPELSAANITHHRHVLKWSLLTEKVMKSDSSI